MSSPTRQISSRKLPPLPGSRSTFANKSTPVHSTPPTSSIYSNEKRTSDKGQKDISKALNNGPFRPALVSTTTNPSDQLSSNKDTAKQCKYETKHNL